MHHINLSCTGIGDLYFLAIRLLAGLQFLVNSLVICWCVALPPGLHVSHGKMSINVNISSLCSAVKNYIILGF
jgi:hypothetical protein